MGCIPWADEYMIRHLTPQRETAPPARSVPSPKKGVDARDALYAVYITHRPEGTPHPIVRASACASSRGLSLGVAADTAAANAEK